MEHFYLASMPTPGGPKFLPASSRMTTGAQMNQDEQRAAATMPAHSFYIGRLSARDDHTNWTIVVASRLAEKQWAEPSPQLLAKCLDFYASKFKH